MDGHKDTSRSAIVVEGGVSASGFMERWGDDDTPSGKICMSCKHGNVTVDLFTLGSVSVSGLQTLVLVDFFFFSLSCT